MESGHPDYHTTGVPHTCKVVLPCGSRLWRLYAISPSKDTLNKRNEGASAFLLHISTKMVIFAFEYKKEIL